MSVEIHVECLGQLKTRAVHGPSGTELVTAAPKDNEGDGSSFSPTDLCATSLATCYATVMAIAARKHGIELDGTRVHVVKHMTAEPPRRIARLDLTMTVREGVPTELRERLEAAARGCPVARSIHPDVDVRLDVRWA